MPGNQPSWAQRSKQQLEEANQKYLEGVESGRIDPNTQEPGQGGIDDVLEGAGDAIDDIFSQQEVKPYDPDPNRFVYGRAGTPAYDRATHYQGVGANYGAQGAAASGFARDLHGRGGPAVDTFDSNRYRSMADRSAQRTGGFGNLAEMSRGDQIEGIDRLYSFADQGPGPSAAEAQLRQGAALNMAQQLALARSGRGAGGSATALEGAMERNAVTGSGLNQQLAIQRAQEEAVWRGQQLQALNAAAQGANALRSGDIGLYQASFQQRAQDLQAQGLSAEQAMAQARLELESTALNDRTALGYESVGLGYGQLGLGYDQHAANELGNQLRADMAYEGMRGGNIMAAAQANAGFDAQRDQGMVGLGMGALSLMAMSDARNKTEIATDNDLARGFASMSGPYGSYIDWGADLGMSLGRDEEAAEQGQASGMGAYHASTLASDKRAKTDERSARTLKALEQADGYSYRYRDPEMPGAAPGVHYGPMAQELAETPEGRSTLVETPNGLAVDTGRLALLNASATGELARKYEALRRAA